MYTILLKMSEYIKQLLEKFNIPLEDPTPVLGEEDLYYYTYIVVPNNENSKMYLKVYFGQHTTAKLDDGYIASGIKIKSYLKKHPGQFYRKILGFYKNADELNQAEKDLIDGHINKDYCLNLKEGGDNAKWSEESKKKLSDTMKGDSCWMRGRNGELNPFWGKQHSEEICKKLSEAKKGENHPNWGKQLSDETKKKISEANKGENHPMYGRTGEDSPWWGKHHSEESKKKMSEAAKGRTPSEETRRKLSESLKGKNFKDSMTPEAFEEWRRNNSESKKGKMCGEKNPMYGKKHSAETKKKMSDAKKGKKHPNSKPVEVEGVPYVSITAAAKARGKGVKTIERLIKKGEARYI